MTEARLYSSEIYKGVRKRAVPISIDGVRVDREEILKMTPEERAAYARRLVAERVLDALYGEQINQGLEQLRAQRAVFMQRAREGVPSSQEISSSVLERGVV